MKKTYINPTVNVVKVNTSKLLLTGSNENMTVHGEYGSGVTIGSRRNTSWDDEDEDY